MSEELSVGSYDLGLNVLARLNGGYWENWVIKLRFREASLSEVKVVRLWRFVLAS